jgi:hypothetical protein
MSNKPQSPDLPSEAKTPGGYRLVEISGEQVEPYKVLKFEGLAQSGVHAKAAISAGRSWLTAGWNYKSERKLSPVIQ